MSSTPQAHGVSLRELEDRLIVAGLALATSRTPKERRQALEQIDRLKANLKLPEEGRR